MHRFFARHSFKAHDRLLIAATCVFLAGKVEETQVSLPDIIKYYFQATKETIPDKQQIADLKERILVCLFFLYECMYVCLGVVDDASVLLFLCGCVCVLWCVFLQVSERVLLHTIAFQLSVVLPYTHVHRLAKSVLGKNAEKQTKLVVKTAWTFVADRSVVSSFFLPWSRSLTLSRLGEWNSMKTSLCLQFHEANIAAAATYMALSYLGIDIAYYYYFINRTPNPNP